MSSRRTLPIVVLGTGLGFTLLVTLYLVGQVLPTDSPEQVAESFFTETYTRDFSAAWERVSEQDKAARAKQDYLAENPEATPAQAALLSQLASWGTFQPIAVASTDPEQAVVSARVRYPNSTQASIDQLIAAAADPAADRGALLAELMGMYEADELQFLEGDVSFDLVWEGNRWRIVQHWGHGITVLLEAAVSPGLPWDFYPVQDQITAVPGELVRAIYMARNNSDEAITAKAIHEVGPAEAVRYFQTIQCFCFTEQTLEPNEAREMVLMFRIDFSAPRELQSLGNRYTFYTLDEFPTEG